MKFKKIFTSIFIMFYSTILCQQLDTWEVKLSTSKSVEPALAVNPTNGNILTVFMEYSNSDSRILYTLLEQSGEVISDGVLSIKGADPDVLFDVNGNAYILYIDQTYSPSRIVVRRSLNGDILSP